MPNRVALPGNRATGVKAQNVSTIDEFPDSNWFTNRSARTRVRAGAAAQVRIVSLP